MLVFVLEAPGMLDFTRSGLKVPMCFFFAGIYASLRIFALLLLGSIYVVNIIPSAAAETGFSLVGTISYSSYVIKRLASRDLSRFPFSICLLAYLIF